MNILRIDSSINGADGSSSQLSHALSQGLLQAAGGGDEMQRNLAEHSIPHIDAQALSAAAQGEHSLANELIAELKRADTLIIAAPMYNFGISSQLKAWFDHIARAGETFRYTSSGPQGLLKNKKAFVISSRGGVHKDSPRDLVMPYIRQVLSFIGIDDVELIYAEGLGMSDHKDKALQLAHKHIHELVEQMEPAT